MNILFMNSQNNCTNYLAAKDLFSHTVLETLYKIQYYVLCSVTSNITPSFGIKPLQ